MGWDNILTETEHRKNISQERNKNVCLHLNNGIKQMDIQNDHSAANYGT
jgi:hypothetical protein